MINHFITVLIVAGQVMDLLRRKIMINDIDIIRKKMKYKKFRNIHIKTINGHKYYYESVRVGKKIQSKYLGKFIEVGI